MDQESLFIVGHAVSHHPNDQHEAEPTVASIPPTVGSPHAAALDTGYFSEANIQTREERGITPYIATGRSGHYQGWRASCALEPPAPPPEGATPRATMAHALRTAAGQAIYRRRKCTVEPVFGGLKEVHGFRQFSVRGLTAVGGKWCLLCVAYNLKRLHTLLRAQGRPLPGAALFRMACQGARQSLWRSLVLLVGCVCRLEAHRDLFSPTGC